MKTVVINRNSWHFRAQAFVFQLSETDDFCGYVRRVLWSVFVFAFIGAMLISFSGAFLYSAGDFIGWLVSGLFYGFVSIEDVGTLFSVLLFFASVAGLCLAVRAGAPKISEHSPDFLVDAYRSFKDRVCYRLDVRG